MFLFCNLFVLSQNDSLEHSVRVLRARAGRFWRGFRKRFWYVNFFRSRFTWGLFISWLLYQMANTTINWYFTIKRTDNEDRKYNSNFRIFIIAFLESNLHPTLYTYPSSTFVFTRCMTTKHSKRDHELAPLHERGSLGCFEGVCRLP